MSTLTAVDRERLGFRPAERARHLVIIAIDAALFWLAAWSRFAVASELDRIADLRTVLADVREELGA